MALARPASKARRHVFGVTISEAHAEALRAQAERLSLPPTTLAARLLERALDDRKRTGSNPSETPQPKPGTEDELIAAVTALLREVQSVRRAQQNIAVKLLHATAGLSSAQINEWVGRHLTD